MKQVCHCPQTFTMFFSDCLSSLSFTTGARNFPSTWLTAAEPIVRPRPPPLLRTHRKAIGVIESTLACPGTKLEHTAFFSVSSLSLRRAPIVIVIRQSRLCCCWVLSSSLSLSLSFFRISTQAATDDLVSAAAWFSRKVCFNKSERVAPHARFCEEF
jgi:hypothetical protein